HVSEECLQAVTPHHLGAGHETTGVGQVSGAALVHHDLRVGEQGGHVAGAAGMVEVDVGDHDGGQVLRCQTQRDDGVLEDGDGSGCTHFDDAGAFGADQVTRHDPRVTGEHGVDRIDLVAQGDDARG